MVTVNSPFFYSGSLLNHFDSAKRRANSRVKSSIPKGWKYKIKTQDIAQWNSKTNYVTGSTRMWSIDFTYDFNGVYGHFTWSPCSTEFSIDRYQWQIRGFVDKSKGLSSEEVTRIMWGDFLVVQRCVELIVDEMNPKNFGG
jgi:hypothetical protein